MSAIFGPEYVITWFDKEEIFQNVGAAKELASKKGAILILKAARRNLQSGKSKLSGKSTGKMFKALKIRRSKYAADRGGVGTMRGEGLEGALSARQGSGYLVGIFGTPISPWEDSLGATAMFYEYGRSAPGQGSKAYARAYGTGKMGAYLTRERDRVQRPRPFLRPAVKKYRKAIIRLYEEELRKRFPKTPQRKIEALVADRFS